MNYFQDNARMASLRIADFFVVVGIHDDVIPFCHATRILGIDRQRVTEVAFAAKVTARYPLVDRADAVFPEGVELFSFPSGVKIYDTPPAPTFHSFIHTSEDGTHALGCCLHFFEPLSGNVLARMKQVFEEGQLPEKEVMDWSKFYMPKAIVLISRWPFIEGFREVLCQFYRMSLTPIELPIERYISNFIDDVPAPPKEGQKDVNYYVLDQMIRFKCPPLNQPNAWSSLPAQPLFECLDPDHILTIFSAILVERQVVFISSQLSLLTSAAEAITSLIYPLHWVHVYVPVLPLPLIGILAAPLPFIVGILTSMMEEDDCYIGEETVRVYLDENRVEIGTLGSVPLVPEKRRRKLLSVIKAEAAAFANRDDHWRMCQLPLYDSAYQMAMRPDEVDGSVESGIVNEVQVRCAFLNFFVAILMDYRKFMVTDVRGKIFDFSGFLAEVSDSSKDFMEELLGSQAFSQFIESRLIEDERNPDVAFFDESINAKRNRSTMRMSTIETPLLSDKESYMDERTHIPTQPDSTNLPPRQDKGLYMPGDVFPTLVAANFATLRPNTVALGESMALRKNHTVLRRFKPSEDGGVGGDGVSPVRGLSARMGSVRQQSMMRRNSSGPPGTPDATGGGGGDGGATPFTPPTGTGRASLKSPKSSFRFGLGNEGGDVQLDSVSEVWGGDTISLQTSIGSILSTYTCILAQLSRRQSMRSNKKQWGKLPLSTRHILMEYGGGEDTGTHSCQSVSAYSELSNGGVSPSSGRSLGSSSRESISSSGGSKGRSGKLGLGGKVTVGGHNVHRMGSLEVNRMGSSEVFHISSSDVSRSGSMASVIKGGTPSSDISEFSMNDAVGHSGSLMSGEIGGNAIGTFGELCIRSPAGPARSGRNSPVFGGSPSGSDDEGDDEGAKLPVQRKRDNGPTSVFRSEEKDAPKESRLKSVTPFDDAPISRMRSGSFDSHMDSADSYDSVMLMNSGRFARSGSFDALPMPVEMSSMFDSPKLVGPGIKAFDNEQSTYDIALEVLGLFSTVSDAPDDMPFRLLADAVAIAFDPLRAIHLMSIMEAEGVHPDSKIANGISIALSSSNSRFLNNLSPMDVLRARGWGKLQRHMVHRGLDGLEEFMLDLNEKTTREEKDARREIISARVKTVAEASDDPLRVAAELERILENTMEEDTSKWSSPFANMARAFSSGRDECAPCTPLDTMHHSPGSRGPGDDEDEQTTEEREEDYDANPHNMEWIDFQTYRQGSTQSADAPKWQRRYVRSLSRSLLQRMQWSDELICRTHTSLHVDLNHEFGTSCPNSLCGRSLTVEEVDTLWIPDPNRYTVTCPDCEHAFVPRFCVVSSSPSWKGSDGPHTELWCELLSPWSLRKEVLTVLKEYGIDMLTSPSFRQHSSQHTVVFWNLVVAFRLRGLPYSFLITDDL